MSSSNTRKRRRDPQRLKITSNSRRPISNHSSTHSMGTNGNNSTHRNGYNNNNNNNSNHCIDNNVNNTVIPRLSISEIGDICDSECNIFLSYIFHTNGQSLYNILLLQNNLKFENITCCTSNCNIINNGTFYICLHCIFYCCSENTEHIILHCKQEKHYLYFELSSQSIYCCKCGEYHNSPWTDSMIIKFIEMAKKRLLRGQEIEIKDIEIKDIEIIDITEAIWKQFDCIRDNGMLGIRGAYNLGNTCYIAVLLQMFMHNVQLKNYYLSCSHSAQCSMSNSNKNCISCCVEQLFCDFYCGINDRAVSMTNFIGCIWKEPTYILTGQDMHDSHEFFISLTTLMHKTTPSKYKCDDDKLCKCIIHSTFRGLWCSELKCTKCQHISSSFDPFMEINLQPRNLKNNSNNKTIQEALENYMDSEPMPDYKCSKCSEKKCNKYVTIDTLPQTLCLHLKRFEADELIKELSASSANIDNNNDNNNNNNNNNRSSLSRSLSPSMTNNNVTKNNRSRRKNNKNKSENNGKNGGKNGYLSDLKTLNNGNNGNNGFDKIDEYVQFPVDELLDLSQFLHEKRKNDKINNKKYRLRSMIIHSGVLSSGHYMCFIRKNDNWYKCDDNAIKQTTNYVVQNQKAYMLFYEAQ